MGDMGEYWREIKPAMLERSKQKRAANREASAVVLTTQGISYTTHNNGAHLVISAGGSVYDFWPGTGRWQLRGSKKHSRGVMQLVRRIKAAQEQKNDQ